MQSFGDATQGTQRVAFVAGGLKPTDLLLGGLEKFRKILLGKPGLLAEGHYLQRHIPCVAGALEPGGKCRILKVLFEVTVEIRFFHLSRVSDGACTG